MVYIMVKKKKERKKKQHNLKRCLKLKRSEIPPSGAFLKSGSNLYFSIVHKHGAGQRQRSVCYRHSSTSACNKSSVSSGQRRLKKNVVKNKPGTNSNTSSERKWFWIGHAIRKSTNNITTQAMYWNPKGQKKKEKHGTRTHLS